MINNRVVKLIELAEFLGRDNSFTWSQREKMLTALEIGLAAEQAKLATKIVVDQSSSESFVKTYLKSLENLKDEAMTRLELSITTLQQYVSELIEVGDKYIPINAYPDSIDDLRRWSEQ